MAIETTIAVDGQVTIKASDLQPQEVVTRMYPTTNLAWITLLDLKVTPFSYLDLDPTLLKVESLNTSDK